MPEYISISREELYEAVWSTPKTTLMERFKVSDVAIAKACKRRAIPLPANGHWAKVAAGRKIARPPLPSTDPGHGNIHFSNNKDAQAKVLELQEQVAVSRDLDGLNVRVPMRLTSPHPLTFATQQFISTDAAKHNGNVNCYPAKGYDISVSRPQASRALKILDTLVKALECKGAKVTLTPNERGGMRAVICEENLSFNLRELVEWVPDSKAAKSLQDRKANDRPVSTGKLRIQVDEYTQLPVRKTWTDGRRKLEEQLSDIVVGFFVLGEVAHVRTLEREAQHRKWEEERLRREAEERRQALEKQQVEALTSEAKSWETARTISAYLEAIKSTAARDGVEISEEGQFWLARAQARVARIDPLGKRLRHLAVNDGANCGDGSSH